MTDSVALIGFGEAGSIFARDLAARGVERLTAFDPLFATPGSPAARNLARADRVQACETAKSAVQGAELVFVAVTAASDPDAVAALGPLPHRPHVFDVNSVSPGVKRQVAAIVEAAGGRYVETAVMSSIPPKGLATPMLIGGPHARGVLGLAMRLGMDATVFSDEIGPASSVKMCRSVVIKGLESLLLESLSAARFYGVEDDVLASLADTIPGADWRQLSAYMISRSLQHGRRRAEEMREVARTVTEAGLPPTMTLATAENQDRAGRLHRQHDFAGAADKLTTLLDWVLTERSNTG